MLVTKTTPEVLILKLSTGDEIIALVTTKTDDAYIIETPYLLIMTQSGPQYSPMLIMGAEGAPIEISKLHVVAKTVPSKNMLAGYEQSTSKIAIPSKTGIIC